MIEQTFAFSDLPRLFTLAFLELLLSADNAVVLGLIAHTLPVPLRRRALFIGIVSSFFLRAAAILFVAILFENWWIQLLGAAYLLYLSVRYFIQKGKPASPPSPHSFWKVVLLIELFDLVFALDSIVAGIAFIDASLSRLWIVYVGGMIGLIGMRFAADLFGRLIDRFPLLERSAYLMVGWIGVKLACSAFAFPLPPLLFWSFIAFLFLSGFGKLKG